MEQGAISVREAIAILVARVAVGLVSEQELSFANGAIPFVSDLLDNEVHLPIQNKVGGDE